MLIAGVGFRGLAPAAAAHLAKAPRRVLMVRSTDVGSHGDSNRPIHTGCLRADSIRRQRCGVFEENPPNEKDEPTCRGEPWPSA